MTHEYLVGLGLADITGEAAEVGMMGYSKSTQVAQGLHTRMRARAFVFAAADDRVLLVVSELCLISQSVADEVLRRLADRFGGLYTERNVMLTATHTHGGTSGYSHHPLYNGISSYRPKTFAAIVGGIVEAAERAHAGLAPASLSLAHGELHDASVNQSPCSFERNPEQDKGFFPDGIDPQSTTLRMARDGKPVGAVNWFAVHGTSMTSKNLLLSADNKGYAAYHWERLVEQVDYLASTEPSFIAAFAQTNAADMSPNLNRAPGSGPTEDEFENARLIGLRQFEAAAKPDGIPLAGGIDSRLTYIDLADFAVRPEFAEDGRRHRTRGAFIGVSAMAGTDDDPGPWAPKTAQGPNPFWDGLSKHVFYRLSRRLRDAQAPKGLLIPLSLLNRIMPAVQTKVPVQLIRLGRLYLIGIPGEVTVTAGLRLRRTVAAITGADLSDVLVAGYANAYAHYITTPEEYEAQRFEAGVAVFGRWQLAAYRQTAADLAEAMRDSRPAPAGPRPADLSGRKRKIAKQPPPDAGPEFGTVLTEPAAAYRPGGQVAAEFRGAHLANDVRRGGTFLQVQRLAGPDWSTVADDGDWSTKIRWRREGAAGSIVTITWDIPADAGPGSYRIRYLGDARRAGQPLSEFTGTTREFTVEDDA
jgi:neutral ceramidase